MKKLSLLLCLLALTVTGLQAGPVDQQKAQQLGTRFLSATAVGQRNADVQLIHEQDGYHELYKEPVCTGRRCGCNAEIAARAPLEV